VPQPKALAASDIDGVPTDGVLENIAAFLDMLIKVLSHRLTKRCLAGLPSYIEHIVMPVALSVCPVYEQLWREQRLDKVAERVALCDQICISL